MSNRRKPRNPAAAHIPTYWNGSKTPARRGTAVVADTPDMPKHWAKAEGLVGTRINVVEVDLDGVNFGGGTHYLDDRDNSGWLKVTVGHGAPRYGHRNVDIEDGSFRPHSHLGLIGAKS